MALSIPFKTQYNVDATYWVLTRFSIDRVEFSVQLTLAGFPSKEASDTGWAPFLTKDLTIRFEKDPQPIPENTEGMTEWIQNTIPNQPITKELIGLFQTISEFGYSLAKKSTEFAEAENI